MKKTMKKVMAFVIAFLMAISSVPMDALASGLQSAGTDGFAPIAPASSNIPDALGLGHLLRGFNALAADPRNRTLRIDNLTPAHRIFRDDTFEVFRDANLLRVETGSNETFTTITYGSSWQEYLHDAARGGGFSLNATVRTGFNIGVVKASVKSRFETTYQHITNTTTQSSSSQMHFTARQWHRRAVYQIVDFNTIPSELIQAQLDDSFRQNLLTMPPSELFQRYGTYILTRYEAGGWGETTINSFNDSFNSAVQTTSELTGTIIAINNARNAHANNVAHTNITSNFIGGGGGAIVGTSEQVVNNAIQEWLGRLNSGNWWERSEILDIPDRRISNEYVYIWELLPRENRTRINELVQYYTHERLRRDMGFLSEFFYETPIVNVPIAPTVPNQAQLPALRGMSNTIPTNAVRIGASGGTQAQLQAELRNALSGGAATAGRYVVLMRPIVLSSMWEPINDFRGTLDGNGFTISNLHTNGTHVNAGLFGSIGNNMTIRNLNVGIAGQLAISTPSNASGNIDLNGTAGVRTINVSNQHGRAGGLIGLVTGGIVSIENVSVAGGVVFAHTRRTSYNNHNRSHAGGLIGAVTGGTVRVERSQVSSDVIANAQRIGQVGSYATNAYAGGFIGFIDGRNTSVTISNSYVSSPRIYARARNNRSSGGTNANTSRAIAAGFVGARENSAVTLTNLLISTPLGTTTDNASALGINSYRYGGASGQRTNARSLTLGHSFAGGNITIGVVRTSADVLANPGIVNEWFPVPQPPIPIWVRSGSNHLNNCIANCGDNCIPLLNRPTRPEIAVVLPAGALQFEQGHILPRDIASRMRIFYTDNLTPYREITRDRNVTLLYDFSTSGQSHITIVYSSANSVHRSRVPVTVVAPRVDRVRLITPVRTRFAQGAQLDLYGLAWQVEYSNGNIRFIERNNLIVQHPFDITATEGEKVVTVTHSDSRYATRIDRGYFTVTVGPYELTNIAYVEIPPSFPTQYFVGQHFNPVGLTVMGTFSDGSVRELSFDELHFSHDVFRFARQETVRISAITDSRIYHTITVNVLPDSITNFVIEQLPADTNFMAGHVLGRADLAEFSARVERASGDIYRISGHDLDIIFPRNPLVAFDTFARLIYHCRRGGADRIFDDLTFTVTPEMQTGIEITKPPTVLTYIDGEQFNPDGLEVTRVFNTGRREVTTDFTLSHGVLSVSDFVVTVMDGAFTVDVFVHVRPLPGISMNRDTITLMVGATDFLWANVVGVNDSDVTWHSNRPDIALVNEDGFVTAVSEGVAVITATSVEGGLAASATVTVVADSVALIAVSTATTLPGNTATVDISIANNPGITAMGFYVAFDDTAMTLVNVANTGALNAPMHPTHDGTSPVRLTWSDPLTATNNMNNGIIATLTFLASGDAIPDSYDIIITPIPGSTLNTMVQPIHFHAINGSVIVAQYNLGDVNDDGDIDMADAVILTRLTAGWSIPSIMPGLAYVNMFAADVNADGAVDMVDAFVLMRHTAGWSDFGILPWTPPTPVIGFNLQPLSAATLHVGNAFGEVGETVKIPISISNNPGITSMGFYVSFNDTALRFTGYDNTDELNSPMHPPDRDGTSPVRFTWADALATANNLHNGDIVVLEFEILDGATAPQYAISLDIVPGSIRNAFIQNVPFAVAHGYISTPATQMYHAAITPETKTFPMAQVGYNNAAMEQIFTITNTGTGTLTNLTAAMHVLPTGVQFEISTPLSTATLAPDTSATIGVRPIAGLPVGNYFGVLEVVADNNIELVVVLEFIVSDEPVVSIAMNPLYVAFPAAQLGYDPAGMARAVVVNNNGTVNITDLTAVITNAYFTIDAPFVSSTLNAGESKTIYVRPVAGLTASATPYEGTLVITGSHDVRHTVNLSFVVSDAPIIDARINPTSHVFISAQAGYNNEARSQLFVIENIGTVPITGLEALLNNAYFEINEGLSATTIPVGGSVTISVRPVNGLSARAAAYTAILRVTGDAGINVESSLSFTVTQGQGIIFGDLTGTGEVTTADLVSMLRLFAQPGSTLPPEADVNGDGRIDSADLILFLRFFAQPGIILGPQGGN
ncbi:MAG: dockerin type I domain-containing protein [Defluviitaleaceae bacterium]|nr:dockerin type I domain-containing protein [Defluviitaleaceae bacterium]MCL2275469.1 dockerin type I domain-containing protein [Defluviitaleaceae bacterium]